ncbi:hypothetical protein LSUB1_G004396 [Lachnellula subtilissima]|uniref:C2H2-type domain-containing protein n=1 Tax=Lachnellula subtilissima TaxID=602034 RepID=A0A8H8RQZ4_9HELO|nr:hypothetical protein LSUB1_G004396 [Lachnellula subtilissima]
MSPESMGPENDRHLQPREDRRDHLPEETVDSDNPSSLLAVNVSTIPALSRRCLGSYKKLCDALGACTKEDARHREFDLKSSTLLVEDARLRFTAWARNIAALHGAHQQTSLEYRLRDARSIRKRLLRMLKDLLESLLAEALSIVSGDETNETWSDDAISDTDDRVQMPGDTPQKTELDELFLAIQRSNSNLMKLRWLSEIPLYDIGHVQEKYGLAKYRKGWLTERLGKAITRRRQYLKYREEHHAKLTKDWMGEENEEGTDPDATVALTKHTKATTFTGHENHDYRDGYVAAASTLGSQTSYEATVVGAITKITVPPLPQWAFENIPFEFGEPFQCPYCYTDTTVKNRNSWKKHIFRDLKPYVCTFKECTMRMFSSRNDWFSHEIQYHRREWVCPYCHLNAFTDKPTFTKHLANIHSITLSTSQLDALVLQSEEPINKIPAAACPLCDEWEANLLNTKLDSVASHSPGNDQTQAYGTIKRFRTHLGRHMEQLALFALPMVGIAGEEDESPNNAVPADLVMPTDALIEERQHTIHSDSDSDSEAESETQEHEALYDIPGSSSQYPNSMPRNSTENPDYPVSERAKRGRFIPQTPGSSGHQGGNNKEPEPKHDVEENQKSRDDEPESNITLQEETENHRNEASGAERAHESKWPPSAPKNHLFPKVAIPKLPESNDPTHYGTPPPTKPAQNLSQPGTIQPITMRPLTRPSYPAPSAAYENMSNVAIQGPLSTDFFGSQAMKAPERPKSSRPLSSRFDAPSRTSSAFENWGARQQDIYDAYNAGYYDDSYAAASEGVPRRREKERASSRPNQHEADDQAMPPPSQANLRRSVARDRPRRNSDPPSKGSEHEDKIRQTALYQEDIAEPTVPLTAELLKRQLRRQAGSSRSTQSSASQDESDWRKSATTMTTRSGSGEGEAVTIKVTGPSRVMVGGAMIDVPDGGEIEIKRQQRSVGADSGYSSRMQSIEDRGTRPGSGYDTITNSDYQAMPPPSRPILRRPITQYLADPMEPHHEGKPSMRETRPPRRLNSVSDDPGDRNAQVDDSVQPASKNPAKSPSGKAPRPAYVVDLDDDGKRVPGSRRSAKQKPRLSHRKMPDNIQKGNADSVTQQAGIGSTSERKEGMVRIEQKWSEIVGGGEDARMGRAPARERSYSE